MPLFDGPARNKPHLLSHLFKDRIAFNDRNLGLHVIAARPGQCLGIEPLNGRLFVELYAGNGSIDWSWRT